MGVEVRRPAVPEKCDGQAEAEPDAHRQTHLGLKDAAVGLGLPDNGLVGEGRDDSPAGKVAEPEADVYEAGDANVPVVGLSEDDGNGGEEEV